MTATLTRRLFGASLAALSAAAMPALARAADKHLKRAARPCAREEAACADPVRDAAPELFIARRVPTHRGCSSALAGDHARRRC